VGNKTIYEDRRERDDTVEYNSSNL
jgi:hypothetical protein